MKQTICDACGRVIDSWRGSNDFNIQAHCTCEYSDYVDENGVDYSGKMEYYDLCQKCYNRIMRKAWEEFVLIQKKV